MGKWGSGAHKRQFTVDECKKVLSLSIGYYLRHKSQQAGDLPQPNRRCLEGTASVDPSITLLSLMPSAPLLLV